MTDRDTLVSQVAAEWARSTQHQAAGSALVLADPEEALAQALSDLGWTVDRWHRNEMPDNGRLLPSSDLRDLVALRIPRSKRESEMMLAVASARLRPGGTLAVYGATDEGIKSVTRLIPPGHSLPEAELVKRRCRVWVSKKVDQSKGEADAGTAPQTDPTDELADWTSETTLSFPFGDRTWTFFPGMFAESRLDEGTEFLLRQLHGPGSHLISCGDVPPRVLDFAAGSGTISAWVLDACPEADVHMLDIDRLSLEAARRNVPKGRVVHGNGLADAEGPFDLIVSNPPFHTGKAQSLKILGHLLSEAPALLKPDGVLVFVTQKRLLVKADVERYFKDVRSLGDHTVFRVWTARAPNP